MTLQDAVVVIAGAGGGAGPAVARRLVSGGATVVLLDRGPDLVEPLARSLSESGGQAHAFAVDLLDEGATRQLASTVTEQFGRVDGVVHLVGGWRGGQGITEADLADWDWLAGLLVRTVQHTSRAFHDALRTSPVGRYILISAVAASRPTATNASYGAAKAAAEAWTLAVADSFKDTDAAATVLVVKALLTPAMREAKPDGAFPGFTTVDELADAVAALWDRPAREINGERVWLAT